MHSLPDLLLGHIDDERTHYILPYNLPPIINSDIPLFVIILSGI
jgi:hypothetical protein